MKKTLVVIFIVLVTLSYVIFSYTQPKPYIKTSCIGEGHKGNSFFHEECCEGLVSISENYAGREGECWGELCGCFYCTKCGNGICGKGENRCNCEKDCDKWYLNIMNTAVSKVKIGLGLR